MNKDVKLRDKIIFGSYNEAEYLGGCRHFTNLSLSKLKELVANDFIDLRERQNICPCVEEILAFMQKYPDYTAHGYTITIKRNDYRVSLEGVEKSRDADSNEELEEFVHLFKNADDFIIGGCMYCWFD